MNILDQFMAALGYRRVAQPSRGDADPAPAPRKKTKVYKRAGRMTPEHKWEIVSLWLEGKSRQEIEEITRWSDTSVSRVLKEVDENSLPFKIKKHAPSKGWAAYGRGKRGPIVVGQDKSQVVRQAMKHYGKSVS